MRFKKTIWILLLSVAFLTGCNTYVKDQYHWGSYEGLLYDMYNKPGSATPLQQIEQLTTDIEKAVNLGVPVAPGINAHLGMMYAMIGNEGAAEAAFGREKALYPESIVLIDGMMERARSQMQGLNGASQ